MTRKAGPLPFVYIKFSFVQDILSKPISAVVLPRSAKRTVCPGHAKPQNSMFIVYFCKDYLFCHLQRTLNLG